LLVVVAVLKMGILEYDLHQVAVLVEFYLEVQL
jgi:hypothetical protein